VLSCTLQSCEQWSPGKEQVVARVENNYLYKKDLDQKFTFSNSSDSTVKATNFIDRWARKQLLMKQAQMNLPKNEIDTLERLLEEYKSELYINNYKSSIINKSIDKESLLYLRNSRFISFTQTT